MQVEEEYLVSVRKRLAESVSIVWRQIESAIGTINSGNILQWALWKAVDLLHCFSPQGNTKRLQNGRINPKEQPSMTPAPQSSISGSTRSMTAPYVRALRGSDGQVLHDTQKVEILFHVDV